MAKNHYETASWSAVAKGVVAGIYGVSVRTVMTWLQRGCPRNPNKTFNLKAVIEWHEREISGEASQDALEQKIQREKLRALRIRNDHEEGRLIALDVAIGVQSRSVVEARTRLVTLPDRIVLLLRPEDRGKVKPQIAREVDLALTDLAEGTGRDAYMTTAADRAAEETKTHDHSRKRSGGKRPGRKGRKPARAKRP